MAAIASADDLDVLRLGSLLALRDVELDLLPFLQAAVAARPAAFQKMGLVLARMAAGRLMPVRHLKGDRPA